MAIVRSRGIAVAFLTPRDHNQGEIDLEKIAEMAPGSGPNLAAPFRPDYRRNGNTSGPGQFLLRESLSVSRIL